MLKQREETIKAQLKKDLGDNYKEQYVRLDISNRKNAEQALSRKSHGDFIIRKSDNNPNHLIISMVHATTGGYKVHHSLLALKNGTYIEDNPPNLLKPDDKPLTLNQIVQKYISKPVPDEIIKHTICPLTNKTMENAVIIAKDNSAQKIGMPLGLSCSKDALLTLAKSKGVTLIEGVDYYPNLALRSIIRDIAVPNQSSEEKINSIQEHLTDSFTKERAETCVVTPSGQLYDSNGGIRIWIKHGKNDPLTRNTLNESQLISSKNLNEISALCAVLMKKRYTQEQLALYNQAKDELGQALANVTIDDFFQTKDDVKAILAKKNDGAYVIHGKSNKICVSYKLGNTCHDIYADTIPGRDIISILSQLEDYKKIIEFIPSDIRNQFLLNAYIEGGAGTNLLNGKPPGTFIIKPGVYTDSVNIQYVNTDNEIAIFKSVNIDKISEQLSQIPVVNQKKQFEKACLALNEKPDTTTRISPQYFDNSSAEQHLKAKPAGSYVIMIGSKDDGPTLSFVNYDNKIIHAPLSYGKSTQVLVDSNGNVFKKIDDINEFMEEKLTIQSKIKELIPEDMDMRQKFILISQNEFNGNPGNEKTLLAGKPPGTFIIKKGNHINGIDIHYVNANNQLSRLELKNINEFSNSITKITREIKRDTEFLKACKALGEKAETTTNLNKDHFLNTFNQKSAEKKLENEPIGSFLIRVSSKGDAPTLSFVDSPNHVKHYRLSYEKYDNDKLRLVDPYGENYNSIDDIVTLMKTFIPTPQQSFNKFITTLQALGLDDKSIGDLKAKNALKVEYFDPAFDEKMAEALLKSKPIGTYILRKDPKLGTIIISRVKEDRDSKKMIIEHLPENTLSAQFKPLSNAIKHLNNLQMSQARISNPLLSVFSIRAASKQFTISNNEVNNLLPKNKR